MTERVSIQGAAERLGVSADTVRRRLKRGELIGDREETPQGFVWRVELPIAESVPGSAQGTAADAIELAQLRERVAGLERLIDELATRREEIAAERESWKEAAQRESEAAGEFRVLLRQARMLALPPETARQDAPERSEAPAPDVWGVLRESQVSQERRRSFWDWLRGN